MAMHDLYNPPKGLPTVDKKLLRILAADQLAERNVQQLLGQAEGATDPQQRQKLLNQALAAAGTIRCLRERVIALMLPASPRPPKEPPSVPPNKPPTIPAKTPPVTPANPQSCTKYTCSYVELLSMGGNPANYTVWDVCVPSGDWSRASCTFQWWETSKLANRPDNMPDPNHPDGKDVRDACQLPTVFGVKDHDSFVKYCKSKFRGQMIDDPSMQHADVASIAPLPPAASPPPEIALGSPPPPPKAPEPPPEIALGSPPEQAPEPGGPSINRGHSFTPMPAPAPTPSDPWSPPSVPQVSITPPGPASVPPVNIGPPPLGVPPPGPGPSHSTGPIIDTWNPPPPQHTPQAPSPGPVTQPATPLVPQPTPRTGTMSGGTCTTVAGQTTCTDNAGNKCISTFGPCEPGTKQANHSPGETEKKKPQPLSPSAVNPTLPIKPVNRTLPVKPVQPTLPVQSVQQTLPIQPAEPRIAKAEPQPGPAPQPAPAPAAPPQQQAKREEPKPPPAKLECRKGNVNFHVQQNEAVTVPVTIIGSAKCSHRYHPNGPGLTLTEASISSEPSNGTLTQTGDFSFEYVPEPGFKGSDEYAIEVCGEGNRGSGCSTLTYEVTME